MELRLNIYDNSSENYNHNKKLIMKIGETWIWDWEDGTPHSKFRIDGITADYVQITWLSKSWYRSGDVFRMPGQSSIIFVRSMPKQGRRDEITNIKETMSKYET